jgi:hypothetical protein
MERYLGLMIVSPLLFAAACGSRPADNAGTNERSQTLTGYLYGPRSALCMTQASDPSLPELSAALDTVLSSRPVGELLSASLSEGLCSADGEAPVTSLKLLLEVSDLKCAEDTMRPGCLMGEEEYAITGAFEETEICSLVAKGMPLKCRKGEVFVPTEVIPL